MINTLTMKMLLLNNIRFMLSNYYDSINFDALIFLFFAALKALIK